MKTGATNTTKKPAVKLTPAQRAEVQSLVDDSGYSRSEAVATVLAGLGAS